MEHNTTSRRSFLTLAGLAPLAVWGLSACGTSGPGSSSAKGASMWSVSGDPNETIRKNSIDAFGKANAGSEIKVTFFQNDAYKTKIKTAIGADQAPTIIYGWGGGVLKSYAAASQVEDLTSWFADNAAVKEKLFESAFGAATIDGKIYAIPATTVQPIIFYYNKELFSKAGAQPPKTWDDLLTLTKTFNDLGIAPIALAGQSRWTSMMWLEYMFDRVGGPEVFTNIFNNKADAWSDPAALEALKKIQELVTAGGFIKGFSSITADSNADQALLYTGKAAMMLHGAWTYGGMKNDGGDFVPGGNLGWVDFPAVEGGKGDPKNAVGNPSNYLSISAKASDSDKEAAKKFFAEGLLATAEVDAYIASGSVPVVNGLEDKFSTSDDKDFLSYVYTLSKDAPSYQQSWDQALSPTASEALLNNIDQLFVGSITPEEFASNMNATIGK
ncbi:sugar ABC transporter substrate-binding protein [Arthrobacter psychrolactophilus]|uniref:Sugar ABC transporter substrate-binding protein n=1 Tax=Arthrobacter psychrolactophilus TaxID=92442 RepID=A0A2V5IRS1_9MICC|nr:extracellular solute-binding protein [Arthrobacter psychrolactophilus]PYI38711.1 sugar ABC transporter substrate-binding protein [Arthrobacter psychrolactophilus]